MKLRLGQKVEVDSADGVTTGTIKLKNGELLDGKRLWVHMDDGTMDWYDARRLRPHQKFVAGDLVEVTHDFQSDRRARICIKRKFKQGSQGTVLKINDEGDVMIDFRRKKPACWVSMSNFENLKVTQVPLTEPLEVDDRIEVFCTEGEKRWDTGFIRRILDDRNCDIVLDDGSRLWDVPAPRIRRQVEGRRQWETTTLPEVD